MLILPPVTLRVTDPHLSIVSGNASDRVPGTRKRDGGKDPAKTLLRPVNVSSKRGRILSHFLHALDASVSAAMAAFQISRPAVFATWTVLHREHGIGYALDAASDAILVRLPRGVEEPALWGVDHGA